MLENSHVKTTGSWLLALGASLLLLSLLLIGIVVLLGKGVGIWGINIPVAWGFAITNFVWWIGIGHAGTFISAILFLLREDLRTAISRFAETMTIFAVTCAGLFPLLHLGRPWFFYWLLPYYDTMGLWPQFRSPLVWDVFAVGTYLTVSLLFWYLGLIPDIAIYRDQSTNKFAKNFYSILSLGWRGTTEQWRAHRSLYVTMAGLATPLVISVHSIVGLDFAASVLPGWHSTIFPPYFVAGAIFSGFAMVISLGIVIRKALHLENTITKKHLDLCAKFMLAMSIIVSYGYLMEVSSAYISGSQHDIATIIDRYFGAYSFASWLVIFCNTFIPQLLWWPKIRGSVKTLFILSLIINVGMWTERFVIVVQSLSHEFLPSSSRLFFPTLWDWCFLAGSLGLFFTLYFLFVRIFPIVALSELHKINIDKEST
ncbi:MAG: NrfD/PsrC family molybdoenzyme membrane anchor subunit [Bdellovibrio sp.]